MYYNQVKYYLASSKWTNRKELRFEPEGWNEDDKTITRSSENHGVFTQLSNNLAFVKDGYDLIFDHYSQYGTEVDLRLIRRVYRGLDDGYVTDYEGDLDLKSLKLGNNRLEIQFLTGGLQSIIESQKNEKYELQRTTDVDGNIISQLKTIDVTNQGRKIFLNSLLEGQQQRFYTLSRLTANQEYKSALIDITYESDDGIASQVNPEIIDLNPNSLDYITAADMFYISNREAQREIQITGTFNMFDVNNVDRPPYDLNPYINVELHFFDIDNNGNFDHLPNETELIATTNVIGQQVIFNETYFLDIPEDRAVSLLYKFFGTNFQMTLKESSLKVTFKEDSAYPQTTMKGIRVYDAGERLVEIYTGLKNRFKSTLFGGQQDGYTYNGKWERTILLSGKNIRNLPNSKTPLSFNDLFGLDNYFNLGYGVENGNVRMEEKSYFYQNQVFLDLGEIDDLSISIDESMLFSSMTFGNKKAGDYEEVQGLAEYNALTTYQSFLKSADNKYEVDGEVRADAIGGEIARRKQFSDAPTEDTAYDNEIFVYRLHPNINKLRTWQWDFKATPSVYDPESAYNLELTPFESMRRHSNWFNAGLTKNLDRYTRYSNGTGNVDVIKTRLDETKAYAENGTIKNENLRTPLFLPEILEFTKPIDFEINKKIFGNTQINGNFVSNFYLLVQFEYRKQIYKGWIQEINLNSPSKWKLIRKYDA